MTPDKDDVPIPAEGRQPRERFFLYCKFAELDYAEAHSNNRSTLAPPRRMSDDRKSFQEERMKHLSAIIRSLGLALAIAVAISATGCSKKEAKPDESAVPTAAGADENEAGDSDSGKAMGLQTIRFPYDSFTLDSEAKSALASNAQILKDKPGVRIQVEGHCDQRGGIQYNIALGEKRANAVKKYLEDQGIAGDRVTTISFGKERPIDQGSSEDAYAKNRRANFVITAR
jgi:peptidoglycan-associated lipoprotein